MDEQAAPAIGWDAADYLAFADERLRSGFDLMLRLGALPHGAIADLGCGTGEHAAALARRYPAHPVIGVDSSADMLAKARRLDTPVDWVLSDLRDWQPAAPLALLFTNSALQWLPDHATLLPHLVGLLRPGGVLAIQMPRNFDSPAHAEMRALAATPRWRETVQPVLRENPVDEPGAYFDLLAPFADGEPDIWDIEYWNVLRGRTVLDWMRGTGLRPVLSVLSPDDQARFCAEYAERLARAYPPRPGGVTLFPQRRLFVVLRKRT